MRFERWYWLIAFCVVSLVVHVGVVLNSPSLAKAAIPPPEVLMEVALEPLAPEEIKKEEPAKEEPAKPKPEPKPEEKPDRDGQEEAPKPADQLRPAPVVNLRPTEKASPDATRNPKVEGENHPTAPNVDPGGIEKLQNERPMVAGLPSGIRNAGTPDAPRITRDAPGGGGAPAPGPIPGGQGGAPGPEAPPEDIIYNGGGAGGEKLPKVAARIGGGGGRSILSVENPLAKDAIPEDKPGAGPGLGSGQGAGAGGGVGYGRGEGIGTSLDGKVALGTLRSKPGEGIGAGVGRGIGTNAPGGGKGTGAELPGTGGTGQGYGRGSGIGVGNGSGVGVGDGSGSRRGKRGVPFGDVGGLLRGDPDGGGGKGGGPGGPGRGALFGVKPEATGRGGAVHIVYVMDSSGSMREGDKISKAKTELKRALSGLKPIDRFTVLHFNGPVYGMSFDLVPASRENVQAALEYVDGIQMGNNTNISGALERALSVEGATDIYLMSDGKPEGRGITNYIMLRRFVRELNTRKVRINTLALGLGDKFEGVELLKAVAAENEGAHDYIDLSVRRTP
jgi:hypothetical protein